MRVFKFGDNIDTDVIIPAKYLTTSNPDELSEGCMEPIRPSFKFEVQKAGGGIIFAGRNFGCGSSREHAPLALKGCGIKALIAKSFARIFYRNSFNIGIPAIICPSAVDETEEGDDVEINFKEGVIRNLSQAKKFHFKKPHEFMVKLIERGGLMKILKDGEIFQNPDSRR